jgi:hypothetical protein
MTGYNLSKQDKVLIKTVETSGAISIKGALYKYCGELVGRGLNRDVYVYKYDANYVVKIQRTQSFDNVLEWEIWKSISFSQLHKWFAPCMIINEMGTVLIQRKVETKKKKYYPKRLPLFFTDFKYANYGFIGDQFVCCDYAGVLSIVWNLYKNQSRYVKWWNHNGKYLHQKRRARKLHIT